MIYANFEIYKTRLEFKDTTSNKIRHYYYSNISDFCIRIYNFIDSTKNILKNQSIEEIINKIESSSNDNDMDSLKMCDNCKNKCDKLSIENLQNISKDIPLECRLNIELYKITTIFKESIIDTIHCIIEKMIDDETFKEELYSLFYALGPYLSMIYETITISGLDNIRLVEDIRHDLLKKLENSLLDFLIDSHEKVDINTLSGSTMYKTTNDNIIITPISFNEINENNFG
jgi:hypothetical protein